MRIRHDVDAFSAVSAVCIPAAGHVRQVENNRGWQLSGRLIPRGG